MMVSCPGLRAATTILSTFRVLFHGEAGGGAGGSLGKPNTDVVDSLGRADSLGFGAGGGAGGSLGKSGGGAVGSLGRAESAAGGSLGRPDNGPGVEIPSWLRVLTHGDTGGVVEMIPGLNSLSIIAEEVLWGRSISGSTVVRMTALHQI
jgi:hypothetical protein